MTGDRRAAHRLPDRDLVLPLTTGEKTGPNPESDGVMWLLKAGLLLRNVVESNAGT